MFSGAGAGAAWIGGATFPARGKNLMRSRAKTICMVRQLWGEYAHVRFSHHAVPLLRTPGRYRKDRRPGVPCARSLRVSGLPENTQSRMNACFSGKSLSRTPGRRR